MVATRRRKRVLPPRPPLICLNNGVNEDFTSAGINEARFGKLPRPMVVGYDAVRPDWLRCRARIRKRRRRRERWERKLKEEGWGRTRENNKKRETPRADLPTEYSYIVINPFSQGGCARIQKRERATCLDIWPHWTEKLINDEY